MKEKKKEWWQTTFDDKYLKTYVDIIPQDLTNLQMKFLMKVLRPKKGKVLDLACGYGRHSIELTKKGYEVTGLDYSKHFIDLARKKAKEEGIKVTFRQGDMRRLSFKNDFDYVINMFTSFGYFKNESDNLKVLQGITKGLKRNGLFVIDLNNSLRGLIAMLEKGKLQKGKNVFLRIDKHKQSNGITVTTKQELILTTMHWYMTRTWKEKGKPKKYKTDVRMFTLPEITHLMQDASLHVEKVYGDFSLSPYDAESRRMIILARKK